MISLSPWYRPLLGRYFKQLLMFSPNCQTSGMSIAIKSSGLNTSHFEAPCSLLLSPSAGIDASHSTVVRIADRLQNQAL